MTDALLLDHRSREILKVWLRGRERIKALPEFRWNEFINGTTARMTYAELSQIVDQTGSRIIDMLLITKPFTSI